MLEFKKTGNLHNFYPGPPVRTIRIHNAHSGVMESRRGDTYLGVCLEYSFTDSDTEERHYKTRPVFSKEARVIIENGPFSEDEEYVVKLGYKRGFPIWKDIRPVARSPGTS